ncbi:hypothetical protein LOK49_Contig724G00002 [Camellia lanceoleosa]|nr:hypothetical protein LOK49_Contig724G00002 [Camellia lanceoleosa]
MESLIEQETDIMDSMEERRVTIVRKLLMMSAKKRIALSKLYHCRKLQISGEAREGIDLDQDDSRKLNLLNTLPLVSSAFIRMGPLISGHWSAEKYRIGLLHEFLSLTLEKRASIHHIVEFKEEFSLTRYYLSNALKQPRTFTWLVVFTRSCIDLHRCKRWNQVLIATDQFLMGASLNNVLLLLPTEQRLSMGVQSRMCYCKLSKALRAKL